MRLYPVARQKKRNEPTVDMLKKKFQPKKKKKASRRYTHLITTMKKGLLII